VIVPHTAEGFIVSFGALRSLDGRKGVNLHISLSEVRCLRMLIMNLGRRMPEGLSWRCWNFWEPVSRECCSSARATAKRRPKNPPLTPHFIMSLPQSDESVVPDLTLRTVLLDGNVHRPELPP
jgi:hypothetical protein